MADRAQCPAKGHLHGFENLDVKSCFRSEGAHRAIPLDVWPQSCSDKAKNVLAWSKIIPTAAYDCSGTASKFPTTLRCFSRQMNQLEAAAIRSCGVWEKRWVPNLLVRRPSMNTMPGHDSLNTIMRGEKSADQGADADEI
jgi:hypothetical protein